MPKKFVELNNALYNVDQIESIGYQQPLNAKETYKAIVTLIGGQEVKVASEYGAFDHLQDDRVVIPAQPGFAMVRYWGRDNIEKLPVIAWAIEPFGEEFATTPITVDGIPGAESYEDTGRWAVMQPDGIVIQRAARSWDTYQAWQAHQEAAEQKRAVKSAIPAAA